MTVRPRVISRRHRLPADGSHCIDISRYGSLGLGNPFIIGRDGTRAEVIEKYRTWAPTRPHVMKLLPMLIGKTLVCFCAPLPCHGDVLADMVCEAFDEPAA